MDEFGLIVLKEKLQELGYNNKEPRFYVYSQIGLKQLESDSDIWASATDLNMFRELELWIDFNKIHNEDTDDGDMSNGEDFSLSGYDSDEILDDNDYELNVDQSVEFGGLGGSVDKDNEGYCWEARKNGL